MQAPLANSYIAISGLIGAGKSTLAKALGEELDVPVYYESVAENVYLADFYKDLKKYGFPLQVYLLNQRFRQQQRIIWEGKGAVQDRSLYEDSVFAKMLYKSGNMEERDYNTYLKLFSCLSNYMMKPNVIVHLDVAPEESLRRIALRNRECEKGISIEYLTALSAAYDEFLQDISTVIPVIRVNWNQFQPTADVIRRVKIEFNRLQNIRHVEFDREPEMSPTCSQEPTPSVMGGAKRVAQDSEFVPAEDSPSPTKPGDAMADVDTIEPMAEA